MQDRSRTLLISGLTLFSFYYAYDIPGALNHNLEFGGGGNKEAKISLLYSAYAIPNIVLPLFFSHFAKCSRFGTLLCLSLFVLAGQMLFTLGVFLESFTVMLVGRALFGVGCESYSVIQNKIITEYFKLGELSTAMSLYSACGRLGTISNFLLTPLISSHSNVVVACIVGCVLVGVSVQLCYKGYTDSKRVQEKSFPLEYPSVKILKTSELDGTEVMAQNSTRIWRAQTEYPPNKSYSLSPSPAMSGDVQAIDGFHPSFTTLTAICFLFGMAWAPFYNIAPMMYQKRFGMDKPGSSRMLSYVEGASMLLVLVVCPLVDRYGYKLAMVSIGSIFLAFAHLTILLSKNHPYYSIFLLGIACPLVSCYWLCLPKLVSDDCLAFAFAILYCASNLALTVSPIVMAYLVSRNPSYSYSELYVIGLAVGVFCFTVLLSYQNTKYKLRLNKVEY